MDENKFPPPPVPFPPKQKPKPGSRQANELADSEESVLSEDETSLASLFSEEELSKDEKLPPQTDWHLPGLFSAEYIDPFTVPAAHMLEQGMKIDIASMLEAARLGEEQAAAGDDAHDPAKDTAK